MCGIYGTTRLSNMDTVHERMGRIAFRGPDHTAVKRIDNIILGHNRLAIVDLDPRSNQPFNYGDLHIVFNGEIYNYLSLKAELSYLGFGFSTGSDTEVLLAAYKYWGMQCLSRLNGMFSFVIFDQSKQILFGARDRIGKKPLYYIHQGRDLEFASQISQLSIGKQLTIDPVAVSQYLMWGYIHEPRTIWKGISKLEAGYAFRFDLSNGNFYKYPYWNINNNVFSSDVSCYEDAKSELQALITDAIKIRLQADVKLGMFLSGGIDSSLIAALASRDREINTFSVKFNDKSFDESAHARKIALHLGTRHHEIVCDAQESMRLIEKLPLFFDEPFADPSALPCLLLNKYARQHVTVALSGDGGDESFLGYTRYRRIKQVSRLYRYPVVLRHLLAKLISLSPSYRHKLIGEGLRQNELQRLYVYMLGGVDHSMVETPEHAIDVPGWSDFLSMKGCSLDKISLFDIQTYLAGDINTKVDRSSMAYSVECRAPLMDYRVIQYAAALPVDYKYHKGVQKRILKDILYKYVPATFFNRPKAGFSIPLATWFRTDLKEMVLDTLNDRTLHAMPGIKPAEAHKFIVQHMSGKWNRSLQIWKLLVLQQWLDYNRNVCSIA